MTSPNNWVIQNMSSAPERYSSETHKDALVAINMVT